jgi:hypothetical protein
MAAHLIDHFFFYTRRLTERTKNIVFGAIVFTIVGCFWWFRALAFGVEGPINEVKGLQWRKVSASVESLSSVLTTTHRLGTCTTKSEYSSTLLCSIITNFPFVFLISHRSDSKSIAMMLCHVLQEIISHKGAHILSQGNNNQQEDTITSSESNPQALSVVVAPGQSREMCLRWTSQYVPRCIRKAADVRTPRNHMYSKRGVEAAGNPC